MNARLRWLLRPVVAIPIVIALAASAYASTWAMTGSLPFTERQSSAGDAPPADPAPTPSESPSSSPAADPSLSLAFGSKPATARTGSNVVWTFAVTNTSEQPVGITCNNGQNGDVVLTQNGIERYRWSNDRFFTQMVRTFTLAPGEVWRFDLEGTLDVPAGSYTLTATVVCRPAPAAHTQAYSVGAASSPVLTPPPSPNASPSSSSSSATASPSSSASASPSPSPSSSASP